MSNFDLAARFFLQLVIILTTCHGVSVLTRRLRQPHVVSEMIAGVILGPSVFGLLFPDAQEYFFPAESKPVLYVISHLGIVLYMFLVGLEFRTDLFMPSWSNGGFDCGDGPPFRAWCLDCVMADAVAGRILSHAGDASAGISIFRCGDVHHRFSHIGQNHF